VIYVYNLGSYPLDSYNRFCYNYSMLKEILSGIEERPRQFLLLRMIGLDKQSALGSLAIPEGTYKRWVTQKRFQKVYRQIDELGAEYRDDALLMLRDKNYALVVNLEYKMLQKILKEIKEDRPNFARTHLGREIYSRLANEMSTKPEIRSLTWEQLILNEGNRPQLQEGEIIDASYNEAETSKTPELEES